MKDSRKGRRWVVGLSYLLFLSIASIVGMEAGARLLLDDVDTAETIHKQALQRLLNSAVVGGPDMRLSPSAERTIRWGALTFTVRTNALGFRGREMEPRGGDSRHRMLFLGDSMVFGHGLQENETMAVVAEQLLQDAGVDAHVYNGAISGMNTVQEYATARQLVPLLEPDTVVLGYFVGNDPLANMLATIDEEGLVVFPQTRVDAMATRLENHLQPMLASVAFRAIALRAYVPRLRYSWSGEDHVLQTTLDWIVAIQQECHAAGAELTVLLIYPKDGLAGGLTSLLSGSRSLGGRLADRLVAADVSVIDTADGVLGSQPDERFYFEADGHLNAAGARRLAELTTAASASP